MAGEDEGASIVAQDVVTIEASLDIERAAGGAAAALPAHAPLYPHRKPEGWVVVMCEAGEGRGGLRALRRVRRALAAAR